jgi:hypothetical protein
VRQPRELTAKERVELRFEYGGWADEVDVVFGGERAERLHGARDGGPGGKVAPHGIHGDARQAYASCAVTRCSPA